MLVRSKSILKAITVKKVILSAVALLVAMVAIFIFMAVYEGSTKPIVSVADRLQPDPSWELVSERIEPPRILCISGSCPSLQRSWQREEPMTLEELNAVVAGTGLTLNGDCLPKIGFGSGTLRCEARGTIDGFSAWLLFHGELDGSGNNELTLFLR